MDKGSIKEQREQSGKFRKSHHVAVKKPFQLGKHNCSISRYPESVTMSRLTTPYDTKSIYRPALTVRKLNLCTGLFACAYILLHCLHISSASSVVKLFFKGHQRGAGRGGVIKEKLISSGVTHKRLIVFDRRLAVFF